MIRSKHKHSQPRRSRWTPKIEQLEDRSVPSATPYVLPTTPGVETTAILTVGDSVPELDAATDPSPNPLGFRMVGIPDGMGAYDNGDGTFTVLMNHELGNTNGAVRDHGSKGAFVSRLIVDKATLTVLGGDDVIKTTMLWDTATSSYISMTTALQRLCSADLAPISAYYNAATGNGTTARIFMSGEETNGGRGFAHVATGPEAGTSYEFARIGHYAFENIVASPLAQDQTIVVGLDDSSRNFSSEGAADPSEVYVYIGAKQNTGTEVDKAGLTNGLLYGVRVLDALNNPKPNEGTVADGDRFELFNLGNVENQNAATLQTASIANTVTQFRRVEDGAWDPNHPNDFYFVTTDQFGAAGFSKLWLLRFDDVTNPGAGGTIELLIDGGGTGSNTPETGTGEMFDNITVDNLGRVLLQEDVGNQTHLGKVWMYDIASGGVLDVARHDANLFLSSSPNYIGTQDEESSGIIDLSGILGDGYYLLDVQAHYNINSTPGNEHGFANPDELVQGGQLLVMKVGATAGVGFDAATNREALVVLGTQNSDHIKVTQDGSTFSVLIAGNTLGQFSSPAVISKVFAQGYDGNDHLDLSGVQTSAAIYGGDGNDNLTGGSAADYLSGGDGNDKLDGGAGADRMEGGLGNDQFVNDMSDILLDFGLGQDHKKKK